MKPETPIKALIWLYLLLLVFEGSLRKWVLPDYSDVLLIARDPVVIAIYLLTLARGGFPLNGWVLTTGALTAASYAASLLAGQDNFYITLYGIRTNYLHLPLIWVMATTLTRRDVENLGKAVLLLTIPMTLLMVAQFESPRASFLNRGVGGDDETMGQLYGALGHIRPPGFFSFITGPQLFFPLAAAFLCHEFVARRRLWLPLLVACGVAIVVAIPISISRTLAIATLFIFALALPVLVIAHELRGNFIRTLLIVGAVLGVTAYLPIFDTAREAFLSRWDTAQTADSEGVGVGAVVARLFGGWDYLAAVFSSAPFFGNGIGLGSNVAARLSTGRMGFLLAENEWAKSILELGPGLAIAFIGYRLALCLHLLRRAWHRLRHAHDGLPLLLLAAAASAIVFGQWAPPTILGFAVLGAGLCLSACNDEPATREADDNGAEGSQNVSAEETTAARP